MDRYTCLKKSEVVIPEGEEESSSDEDEDDDEDDDEDEEDDEEDLETLIGADEISERKDKYEPEEVNITLTKIDDDDANKVAVDIESVSFIDPSKETVNVEQVSLWASLKWTRLFY